jgi:hypothetical protein
VKAVPCIASQAFQDAAGRAAAPSRRPGLAPLDETLAHYAFGQELRHHQTDALGCRVLMFHDI